MIDDKSICEKLTEMGHTVVWCTCHTSEQRATLIQSRKPATVQIFGYETMARQTHKTKP